MLPLKKFSKLWDKRQNRLAAHGRDDTEMGSGSVQVFPDREKHILQSAARMPDMRYLNLKFEF